MARPRRSDGTRERLVDEGVAAFLRDGYHGTGIKDVLERVRVPKGSFYHYFPSKEAFAVVAIQRYAECFVGRMRAVLAEEDDPLAGLQRFFEALMVDFEESGYAGGCLIANLGGELEGSDLCRDALRSGYRMWRDGVAEALERGQERRQVRSDLRAVELADLLTEAWEGAVIRMKIERSLEPLRRVVARFLRGFVVA